MLLGQRVAMSQLMRGDHSIGKLADYTTQFIGDYVADFIIRSGGWVRLFLRCLRVALIYIRCFYGVLHLFISGVSTVSARCIHLYQVFSGDKTPTGVYIGSLLSLSRCVEGVGIKVRKEISCDGRCG